MYHILGGLALAFIPSAICQPAGPATTQAPAQVEVYERQQSSPSNLLGYTLDGDNYRAVTCNAGDYFTTSSRWAGCVDGTRSLAVGCTKTSVVIYDATTAICPSSIPVCGTYMAYENPDKATGQIVIRCSGANAKATFYRNTSTSGKTTSTTSRSSSETSSLETSARTLAISTITVSATISVSADSADNSSSAERSSTASRSADAATTTGEKGEVGGSQNLAWIAGPIVGGIAGIGIIALLVWIVMLLRKRNAKREDVVVTINEAYMSDKGTPSTGTGPFYIPGQDRVVSAELPAYQGPQPPAELQSVQAGQHTSQRRGAELE